jgi:acyl carrier protein
VTEAQVLERCSRILRDLLADDSIVLAMDTTRDQVPNWDSFGYVNFIVMVEMEFGVKFRVAEVESFPDVGAIVRRVMAQLPAR